MNEDEHDWAIMYTTVRFNWRGNPKVSSAGKTWRKGKEGRAESIKNKSLSALVASGTETIETPDGEVYEKQLDRGDFSGWQEKDKGKYPARFIRYLRTYPPSVGPKKDLCS